MEDPHYMHTVALQYTQIQYTVQYTDSTQGTV
jgi:hypothetical protein